MEVTFQGVDKRFGDVRAVNNLNLVIHSGSLHFLLGPSGCGKTTTLRMLAGLEEVSSGRIFFDGKDVTRMPAADRGIGMVFQNYALWPHMTVLKNIEYGLKLRKLSPEEFQARIEDAVRITQLSKYLDRYPNQLSGGQQQRVALARALAIRPNVLLLDEPLSNLDAKLRLEMRDNITRIHRKTKITTVYVTHDQREALSMGTEVSVMRAGDLIQSGSPRELYNEPKSPFIASFIGETNLIEGVVKERADQFCLVETAYGMIRSERVMGDFKKDEKVYLSVRPEWIQLLLDPQMKPKTEHNNFRLKVKHVTYLGESEQVFFACQQGESELRANHYQTAHYHIDDGDEVAFAIDPTDILVLPFDQNLDSKT
ncbi:MAG: ABC transporter ATP-binding protein [Bradymonadales bacterium]|nr:MAG: ABC transporter ATP-binding protein [Bradymonadales bacterium]